MMNKLRGLTAACLLLSLTSLTGCRETGREDADSSALSAHFEAAWADSLYWDDGKAEVAHYSAKRNIYKKDRTYELTLITVSEDFNEKFRVKTDDYEREDLYKVMKLNWFADIPTDNYPYHFLNSFFFKRSNPVLLHKATLSSQEWCGNTFKEFMQSGDGYSLTYSSYWDNEGTGQRQVSARADLLFEDQLVYSLRALKFGKLPRFSTDVLSSQISNKVGQQTVYKADFSVTDSDSLWTVTVQLDPDKRNTYQFEKLYPNMLRSLQTWDGQDLKLLRTSRYEYWQNQPAVAPR